MSTEQLAEQLARGAAEQAAHLAAWLGLVAEFSRRDGHLVFGMRSVAEFLSWRCGIDPRTAREHARVALRLEGLPLVQEELAAGRITYSKVRAITRAATSGNERLLVSLARDLTAAQLERVVKEYEAVHGAALSNADDEQRRRQSGVVRWVDRDGMVHYEITAPPEDAGVLDAAMAFGSDSLHAAAAKAKTPVPRAPIAKRQLEALLWVTRRGLVNANRDDLVDDGRYLVVLHVREGQAMVTDDGRVDLGNGLAVTPRTLQRLGCGGLLQSMLSSVDGRPLDLGERVRLATRKQRMALKAMYPTCDIPGCDVPFDWCEVHHVVWWEHGGGTDMANLRPRCRRHHHLVHEGGWREVLGPDGRTVLLPPDGRPPVTPSPSMTAVPVAATALVDANRARGVTPPDDLSTLGGTTGGERLDTFGLAMILDALTALDATQPAEADLRALSEARDVDGALAGTDPPTPA